jgi:hypothetical protein
LSPKTPTNPQTGQPGREKTHFGTGITNTLLSSQKTTTHQPQPTNKPQPGQLPHTTQSGSWRQVWLASFSAACPIQVEARNEINSMFAPEDLAGRPRRNSRSATPSGSLPAVQHYPTSAPAPNRFSSSAGTVTPPDPQSRPARRATRLDAHIGTEFDLGARGQRESYAPRS